MVTLGVSFVMFYYLVTKVVDLGFLNHHFGQIIGGPDNLAKISYSVAVYYNNLGLYVIMK